MFKELKEKIDHFFHPDELTQKQAFDSFLTGVEEVVNKYNEAPPPGGKHISAIVLDTQKIYNAPADQRVEIVRDAIKQQQPEVYQILKQNYGEKLDTNIIPSLVSSTLEANEEGPHAYFDKTFPSRDMGACVIASPSNEIDTLREFLDKTIPSEYKTYPENAIISNEQVVEGEARHEAGHCTDGVVIENSGGSSDRLKLGEENFADKTSYQGHPAYEQTMTYMRALGNFFQSDTVAGESDEIKERLGVLTAHSTAIVTHNEQYMPTVDQMKTNWNVAEAMHKMVMLSKGFDNIEQARDLLKSHPQDYVDAVQDGILKYNAAGNPELSDNMLIDITVTTDAMKMFMVPKPEGPGVKVENSNTAAPPSEADISATPLAHASAIEVQSTNPQNPVVSAIVPAANITVAQAGGSSVPLSDMQQDAVPAYESAQPAVNVSMHGI